MFDDLRNDNSVQFNAPPEEDTSDVDAMLQKKPQKKGGLNIGFNSKNFLGMNGFQRFVVSLLLFFVVCIMGAMILMLTGAVVLF